MNCDSLSRWQGSLCTLPDLTLLTLCVLSGWPSGSHLGHPANAPSHRGPYSGLHSWRRDQQCAVGIHSAWLDRHLLQQLPGDPQSVVLVATYPHGWGLCVSHLGPTPSKKKHISSGQYVILCFAPTVSRSCSVSVWPVTWHSLCQTQCCVVSPRPRAEF